jgi:hypothetical protein
MHRHSLVLVLSAAAGWACAADNEKPAEVKPTEAPAPAAKPPPDRPAEVRPAPDVSAVANGLRDRDLAVRFRAVREAGRLGAAGAGLLPLLGELAERDPDEDIRRMAHAARDKIRPPTAADGDPAAGLRSADPAVRFKAVKELSGRGAAAADSLGELSRLAAADADEDVRSAARTAAERVRSAVAERVRARTEMLADPDPALRLAAVKALEALGPSARSALPALTSALRDPDADVRRMAERAVDRILTGQASAPAATPEPPQQPLKPEPPAAAPADGTITPVEARRHVGQVVTVAFTVRSVGGNSNWYLNSEADFRSPANFTVVLPAGVQPKFREAGVATKADVGTRFIGKAVRVRGTVTPRMGGIQITVEDPGQIEVAEK